MELSVYKIDGTESGKKVVLNDAIFGIEPNDHAIYLDVKQYLANQRQGTAKTKDRSEVAYSTKKLIRQKGSGGARHGSLKAGIYVGGGRVFGPVPRDYSFKLNKKLKRLARRSALSYKMKDEAIKVVEDFAIEAPRTKSMIAIMNGLKVADKKILVVLPESNLNISLSARNLQNVKVIPAANLTTYDVMNASSLVIAEGAVNMINEMLA